jgi:SAM-dependent methyltransferase
MAIRRQAPASLEEDRTMPDDVTRDSAEFQTRFQERARVERYRDRFRPGGKFEKTHQNEQAALRSLLTAVGPVDLGMDLPAGTGRLTPVLAEFARRVIIADASSVMLEVAREDTRALPAEYLLTDAEDIRLPAGAVDVIFCHRFLNHIYHPVLRAKIFAELARVTKRYLIVSYSTPGVRTRLRWWIKSLLGLVSRGSRPVSLSQFMTETAAAGFCLARQHVMRQEPLAMMCLFEKTDGPSR